MIPQHEESQRAEHVGALPGDRDDGSARREQRELVVEDRAERRAEGDRASGARRARQRARSGEKADRNATSCVPHSATAASESEVDAATPVIGPLKASTTRQAGNSAAAPINPTRTAARLRRTTRKNQSGRKTTRRTGHRGSRGTRPSWHYQAVRAKRCRAARCASPAGRRAARKQRRRRAPRPARFSLPTKPPSALAAALASVMRHSRSSPGPERRMIEVERDGEHLLGDLGGDTEHLEVVVGRIDCRRRRGRRTHVIAHIHRREDGEQEESDHNLLRPAVSDGSGAHQQRERFRRDGTRRCTISRST